jgi:hypothetical protein
MVGFFSVWSAVITCFGNRGLIPSAVIFLYCSWLVFTAVANSPHAECRPARTPLTCVLVVLLADELSCVVFTLPDVADAAKWSGVVIALLSLGFCR